MNAGQMMQMPLGAPLAATLADTPVTTASAADGEGGAVFSGLLQGLTPARGASPARCLDAADTGATGPAEQTENVLLMAQAETLAAAMAAVMARGDGESGGEGAGVLADEERQEPVEQKQDQSPQNVVFGALAAMPGMQQSYGRMPEAEATGYDEKLDGTPVQSARTVDVSQAGAGRAVLEISTTMEPARSPATAQATLVVDGENAPHDEQNVVSRQSVVSAAPQSVTLQQERMSELDATKPANMAAAPGAVSEAAKARSMLQPVLDAYLQPSTAASRGNAQDSVSMESPTDGVATTETAARITVQRAQAGSSPVELNRAVAQPVQGETVPAAVEPEQAVEHGAFRSGNVTATAVKGMVSPEGAMEGGADHGDKLGQRAEVLHQGTPLAGEQPQAVAELKPAAGEGTHRSELVQQVAGQIKEHVAGRDMKGGAEQVVIRLSPESLGELKLNLRMENQCLRVEIVAENSVVRDALVRHSDTLKASLASQNITMETFDVSTGNGRSGASGYGQQGQADWQEMARQRQSASWSYTAGYDRGVTSAIPSKPLYLASTEHSMLDVHF